MDDSLLGGSKLGLPGKMKNDTEHDAQLEYVRDRPVFLKPEGRYTVLSNCRGPLPTHHAQNEYALIYMGTQLKLMCFIRKDFQNPYLEMDKITKTMHIMETKI